MFEKRTTQVEVEKSCGCFAKKKQKSRHIWDGAKMIIQNLGLAKLFRRITSYRNAFPPRTYAQVPSINSERLFLLKWSFE